MTFTAQQIRAAQIKAPDAQALVRKIYLAEGLDRTTATLAEKHVAQGRYTITREVDGYVATRKAGD